MKKIFNVVLALIGFITLGAFTSCSEHVEDYYDVAKDIKIGDILLADNSIVTPSQYNGTAKAIGVVFNVRKDSVRIVSSEDLGKKAYLDSIATVPNVSGNITLLNGKENTAALLLSGISSPAAKAVYEYISPVSSWHLPSLGELSLISQQYRFLTERMQQIGGSAFAEGQYLSSTQDATSEDTEKLSAFCITLKTGVVTSISKKMTANVRPVLVLRVR